MYDPSDRTHLEEDDDVESNTMATFYQRFLCNLRFTISRKIFHIGSHVELNGITLSCNSYEPRDKTFDIDQLYYNTNRYVFSARQPVPDIYNGEVIRYSTDSIHAGYARLM